MYANYRYKYSRKSKSSIRCYKGIWQARNGSRPSYDVFTFQYHYWANRKVLYQEEYGGLKRTKGGGNRGLSVYTFVVGGGMLGGREEGLL